MRVVITLLAAITFVVTLPQPVRAADPYAGIDPLWLLLHEPAVVADLKLTPAQRQLYQTLLDDLDLQFFPLRNRSASEASEGMTKLLTEVQNKLQSVLKPAQRKRLGEILLWRIGITALLREEVATRMRYTETQRKQIKKILDETQAAVTKLEQQLSEGQAREPLEKQYNKLKSDEQTQIVKLLKRDQQSSWNELLGPKFDVSKLGQTRFKAPELVDTGEWINSPAATLEKQRGKVVVLHFYACGCINCIHNYPTYHEWYDHFKNKDVVMIGIHTPETSTERDLTHVRKKAAEEKFPFPVLLDVNSANWNAWGNSMWPCVYVIDKQGYLRTFWPGELKWKGATGDQLLQNLIEKLLDE